jgi:hypothetical protein
MTDASIRSASFARLALVFAVGLSLSSCTSKGVSPVAPSTGVVQSNGASFAAGTVDWSCFAAASFGAFGGGRCDSARTMTPATVRAAATAPGAPTTLTHSVVGNNVVLAWQTGGGDFATSYVVEAGSASGLSNLAAFDTNNALTVLNVNSVPPGSYYVRVRAKNTAGLSAPSNEVLVIVGGGGCFGPPAAPTTLSGSAAGSTVTLTWGAPAGCAPTSYQIEAGSAPGASNLAVAPTGNALTSFTATGVGAGTYYVRVRAVTGGAVGAPSNEVVIVVGSGGGGNPTITIAAYAIVAGRGDPSSHGIGIVLDGQPVTTSFTFPGFVAPHPRFVGPLAFGAHQITVSMVSWDSLLVDVGSDLTGPGSVDRNSIVIVSSDWSLRPFGQRPGCESNALFAGRSTGSMTIHFNVVPGISASACPLAQPPR